MDKRKSLNFDFDNLEVISFRKTLVTRLANRFLIPLLQRGYPYIKLPLRKFDAYIELGGSLFMLKENGEINEGDAQRRENFSRYFQHYFVIGSNFGPFFSQNQLEFYHDFFSRISGSCFRDNYSRQLFSQIENMLVAPDVVLAMATDQIIAPKLEDIPAFIVISVINCQQKAAVPGSKMLANYHEAYQQKLAELIEIFLSQGYRIRLFSFSQTEGDFETCQAIMNLVEFPNKGKLIEIYTHESIETSLTQIQGAALVIASRYHAMILGWLYQLPTFVISYSKKTEQVIQTAWPMQPYIEIQQIAQLDCQQLLQVPIIPLELLTELKEQAQQQFFFFEEFLSQHTYSEIKGLV